uniref:Spermatogenesis-associated protein 6 N-terminal domain-containing protein n=1 Tax=Oryzias latipes TaxID=8090 RepID=A0A3P9KYA5_ORYLA
MEMRKRSSGSKKPTKYLKCTVYVNIRSVTCPGVFLEKKSHIYLSVCIMGQRRTTASFPPLFPVLLQSKLTFEKTFSGVVDPADVADLLEGDTTSFQLIQLVSPEAQILATMEERSRDFLFPPPRLISTKGAWREVLLKRSSSFPGISPRVEFTTTSIMEGSDGADAASPTSCPSPLRLSLAQTSRSSPAGGKGPAFKGRRLRTQARITKSRIKINTQTSSFICSSPESSRKRKGQKTHRSRWLPTAHSGFKGTNPVPVHTPQDVPALRGRSAATRPPPAGAAPIHEGD